jgi:hypothetical protein
MGVDVGVMTGVGDAVLVGVAELAGEGDVMLGLAVAPDEHATTKRPRLNAAARRELERRMSCPYVWASVL